MVGLMRDIFNRLIQPFHRRIMLMIGRAVLTVVDADRKTQLIQVEALDGEVIDAFEHIEPYGYTSHPRPGAEAILVSVGGMRQHSVAVVVGDKRYRIQGLSEGEVCIYSDEDEDSNRHRITMKRGRVVEVEGATIRLSASGSVVMEGSDISLSGNVSIGSGSLTHNGTNVSSTHRHSGVQRGSLITDGPQ